MIPKLEKGDEKAKGDFLQVLQQVLIKNLQDKKDSSKKVRDKVTTFHDKFEPLYQAFLMDFHEADKKIQGDDTQIRDKQADLLKWEAKAEGYIIAAVMLAIAEPATATATFALSTTGIGLLIGGIIMIGELAALSTMLGLYADAVKHVNHLQNEIYDLKREVTMLHAIEKQITGLQKNTNSVVLASANVENGWIALTRDLEDTIKHLQDITPEQAAIVIKTNLSAANKEWGVVLEQAKILQPSGGELPAKKFDSSKDLIKAIEDQAKGA